MPLALAFDSSMMEWDLLLSGASLATDEGLAAAVTISWFTDAAADADDLKAAGLDASANDRRGYWGDALADVPGDLIGSKLWLLRRRTQSAEALGLAQQWATEALDWMIEDGVAGAVNVPLPTWVGERMHLQCEITRPDGTRWAGVWDAITSERV